MKPGKPGRPGRFEAKQPNERERKILFENLAVVVLCLLFALAMSVSLTAAQETETSEESPSDDSVWGGVWERNPDESDDPREKIQEALGGQMGRGGGEGGRPGASGFGGGGRPSREERLPSRGAGEEPPRLARSQPARRVVPIKIGTITARRARYIVSTMGNLTPVREDEDIWS